MATVQGDILVDENGELLFADGDLAVGDATLFHTRDILATQPGEYKQFPTIGAGIADYIGDEDINELIRAGRRSLINDGQKVESFKIDSVTKELIIKSWYE